MIYIIVSWTDIESTAPRIPPYAGIWIYPKLEDRQKTRAIRNDTDDTRQNHGQLDPKYY